MASDRENGWPRRPQLDVCRSFQDSLPGGESQLTVPPAGDEAERPGRSLFFWGGGECCWAFRAKESHAGFCPWSFPCKTIRFWRNLFLGWDLLLLNSVSSEACFKEEATSISPLRRVSQQSGTWVALMLDSCSFQHIFICQNYLEGCPYHGRYIDSYLGDGTAHGF